MNIFERWNNFVHERLEPTTDPEELAKFALKHQDEKSWFDRHNKIIEQIFGADAELFKGILAVTSQAESVPRNVKVALREYFRILDELGKYGSFEPGTQTVPQRDIKPFARAAFGNLHNVLKGLDPKGEKIFPMFRVMTGEDDWIVDRHILRIIFGEDFGGSRHQRSKMVEKARNILDQVQTYLPSWSAAEIQSALRGGAMKDQMIKNVPDYGSELMRNLSWIEDQLKQRMEWFSGYEQEPDVPDEEMGFTPMAENKEKK